MRPFVIRSRRWLLVPALLGLLSCKGAVYPLDEPDRPRVVHAPQGEPRGVVLALHGFNDYRGAFDAFAAFAVQHGYLVEAFDQQGFGANRNRGLWPGNDVLARDLRDRLHQLAEEWPDTPIYVLGESMGAAVATLALATGQTPDRPRVEGIVMVAPAVWGGAAFNPFYRAVLMTSAWILPRREVTGRGLGRRASDNDEALIALGRNPMVIKSTRLDAVAGLVRLMDAAVASAPRLDVETLVLAGQRDEIIPPDVTSRFVARLDPERCLAVVYPDGWHLLLRDLQRQRVWNDIVTWLDGEPPAEAVPCGSPPQG